MTSVLSTDPWPLVVVNVPLYFSMPVRHASSVEEQLNDGRGAGLGGLLAKSGIVMFAMFGLTVFLFSSNGITVIILWLMTER